MGVLAKLSGMFSKWQMSADNLRLKDLMLKISKGGPEYKKVHVDHHYGPAMCILVMCSGSFGMEPQKRAHWLQKEQFGKEILFSLVSRGRS